MFALVFVFFKIKKPLKHEHFKGFYIIDIKSYFNPGYLFLIFQ